MRVLFVLAIVLCFSAIMVSAAPLELSGLWRGGCDANDPISALELGCNGRNRQVDRNGDVVKVSTYTSKDCTGVAISVEYKIGECNTGLKVIEGIPDDHVTVVSTFSDSKCENELTRSIYVPNVCNNGQRVEYQDGNAVTINCNNEEVVDRTKLGECVAMDNSDNYVRVTERFTIGTLILVIGIVLGALVLLFAVFIVVNHFVLGCQPFAGMTGSSK